MEENALNLLSIGQASEYLGVSIDTLRRWEKKGKIASYRSPGGHRYFKKNELDDMFGKKYERSVETKPRKEYETKEKEIPQAPTETIVISEDDENTHQEIVDEIISEKKEVESEIDNFFSRQPKNISIPKLEPIRIVSQMVPSTASMATETFSTQPLPSIPSGTPKLFTSFSQIPDTQKQPSKIKSPINIQFFMIIVSVIVLAIAAIFVVIFFASKPTLVSPI